VTRAQIIEGDHHGDVGSAHLGNVHRAGRTVRSGGSTADSGMAASPELKPPHQTTRYTQRPGYSGAPNRTSRRPVRTSMLIPTSNVKLCGSFTGGRIVETEATEQLSVMP
jgi:hypothetical protein